MKNRRIITYTIMFLIGFFIFTAGFSILVHFSFLIASNLFHFQGFPPNTSSALIYSGLTILVGIAGAFYALDQTKKNKLFYKILMVSRTNIRLNIIVSIIFSVISAIIIRSFSLINLTTFMLSFFLTSYPFSALISYLFKTRKNNRNKLLIIFFVFLLNPFLINYTTSANSNLLQIIDYGDRCGVIVREVLDNSPLKNSAALGRRIDSIGDTKIEKIEDVVAATNLIDSEREIEIVVEEETIGIVPFYDTESERYTLGIIVVDVPCR